MKDTGCQPNFITEKAVRWLKPKVIEPKHVITIQGFNKDEDYDTKVVELVLENDKKIHATVVPKLNIKLNLPELGTIVKEFKDKGYNLADENLNEKSVEIDDFDFILGSVDDRIVPLTGILFGENEKNSSIYYDVPQGVILVGSMDKLFTDVKYLKSF